MRNLEEAPHMNTKVVVVLIWEVGEHYFVSSFPSFLLYFLCDTATGADLQHRAANAEGSVPDVLLPSVIQYSCSSAYPGMMHEES